MRRPRRRAGSRGQRVSLSRSPAPPGGAASGVRLDSATRRSTASAGSCRASSRPSSCRCTRTTCRRTRTARSRRVTALTAVLAIVLQLGISSAFFRFYFDAKEPPEKLTVVRTSFWFTMAMSTLGLVIGLVFAGPIGHLILHSAPRDARARRRRRPVGADELPAADRALPRRGALDRVRHRERRERAHHGRRDGGLRRRLPLGRGRPRRRQLHGDARRVRRARSRTGTNSSGSSSTAALFRKMQHFGMPLVPSALALWAINFIDREFVVWYKGLAEVGVYSVAIKIASILTFVMVAFRTAWPAFAYSIEDDRDARRTYAFVLTYLLAFASWVALALGALAPWWVHLLTSRHSYFARGEGHRAARVRRGRLRRIHGARDRQRAGAPHAAQLGRDRRRARSSTSG